MLQKLVAYVRQPETMTELRERSGNNLKEKLRQQNPTELSGYQFLHRNSFDTEAQGKSLLAELNRK